jgi:branched-chain amino acid transport system substrate-binding protein
MKQKHLFLIVCTMLLALGLSLGLTERAQAAPPKEFVINHVGDMTGPYAPITGAAAVAAMEDFQDFINAAGGIKGVKVKCTLHDTRNKRDTALSFYSQVAAQKPPVMFLHQSADMEVLKERVAEDKIPTFCYSPTPKTIWPPGWLFQTLPEYTDQFGLFIDWMLKNWKGQGKPRIAFVNPDYPYGHTVMTPQCLNYMKQKGVELVARELFPPFDVDATTQMTRVAALKPDWIYSMTIASQPRVILKSAETVGLLGTTRFGMGCWGMDIGAAKVAGGLMEGVVGIQPYWVRSDGNLPTVKKVIEIFEKKNRKPEQFTMAYSGFWLGNALTVEAVSETVERVGWDKLNGQAVFDTLTKHKEFKALGLQPFKLAAGKRTPLQARVVEIKKDQVVPISDWLPCPDLRPEEFK